MRDDEEPITQEGKPDLAVVTTQELIRELMDRHAGIVISRIPKNEDVILTDWNGGYALCIGLATNAHHRLLNGDVNNGKPVDGE